MEKVRRLRAMGSLCRQQAAYNGMNKWKLLAEAEYWEHLAEIELSAYFQECNVDSSTSSHDLAVVRKLLQSGDEVTLKPKVGPTRQTSGALQ
ncbi:hypothetical protein [Bradyrhizobium sp. Rc2d]|uniref:hypothetical protein n=1 Tax=Bradyrhizobium sp. Rc2d TaxID=1855321 RepID=UPI001FCD1D8B|nr:hypothetical protein [Bradyrhizobium sp. Rc2d]